MLESNAPELVEALDYLRTTKRYMIFPDKYLDRLWRTNSKIDVGMSDNFPFVLHNGKKLFFPKLYAKSQVASTYKWLLIELDPASPHTYFSKIFPVPSENEILMR